MKPLIALVFSVLALFSYAEWITVPIDITVGAGAVETATLATGAGTYTTTAYSALATTTNVIVKTNAFYTAGNAEYLRSVSVGTIQGATGNVKVSFGDTTYTFTNGAPSQTPNILLAANTAVSCVSSNATNAVVVTIARQSQLPNAWTAAEPAVIRSITIASQLGTDATNIVTTITNSVSTALTVLTNNATYSTVFSVVTGEKIYFLPSLLGTNTATATITYQYLTGDTITLLADNDAIRLYSLRQLDSELPVEETTYVTATYTAYAQAAAAYHIFSNGTPVKTESTYKLLLPGDTITLTPTALTNSVRYRAITERQIR